MHMQIHIFHIQYTNIAAGQLDNGAKKLENWQMYSGLLWRDSTLQI